MIYDKKLYIFNDSTDLTRSLSLLNGSVSVSIGSSNYLYIGFRKPLYNLFMEFSGANANINDSLIVEKYNGTAFAEVENNDNTFGFYKSGFILMEQTLDSQDNLTEQKTTIEGKELYWVRISSSTTITVDMQYLNMIFNSQEQMFNVEPRLNDTDFFPSGFSSFLPCMVACRDQILSDIRVSGNFKYNGEVVKNVNQFDVYDISDFETPATYLSLHYAIKTTQDSTDGFWGELADFYYKKYKDSMRGVSQSKFIAIDQNDDGAVTDSEINDSIQGITFIK